MENNKLRPISDQAIRSFLLGQLDTQAQEDFELNLFTDPKLEARVRLAECEMSDDYAFGRLSQSERAAFREKFLLTSERRQKLQVSDALNDRFATASSTRVPSGQRLRTLFDLKQRGWKYAFAALILVLIFATVLLVTKEPKIARFIPRRFQPRPAATATPNESHHAIAPSSPGHEEQSPPMKPHEIQVMELALSAKTPLEQSPILAFPNNETSARFQLSIENGSGGSYRAELATVEGEMVFSA